jgi:multiple sugar transport system substrate-binding protein
VFERAVNIDQGKSGQVVTLDDIIAETKSDYTDADIKSPTVDLKNYQVKMVDDMWVLYYRESVLERPVCSRRPPSTS